MDSVNEKEDDALDEVLEENGYTTKTLLQNFYENVQSRLEDSVKDIDFIVAYDRTANKEGLEVVKNTFNQCLTMIEALEEESVKDN